MRLRVDINPFTNEPVEEIISFLEGIPDGDYVSELVKKYVGMGNTDIFFYVDFKNEEDALAFRLKFDCI